nr:hypothetical protein [Patescibacteria group bacterium]
MFLTIIIFIFLLIAVWIGSGLVVGSIDKIRKKMKMSSFVLSFFVLGVFTTIPELAIGLNAVSRNEPEIFVGNLLGGTIVIFLLIIPILAILGNGIKLKHKLSKFSFIVILTVTVLPAFFILDKKITTSEAIILILSYIFAGYAMQERYKIFSKKRKGVLSFKKYSFFDLLKLLTGIIIIFVASQFIVEKALSLSNFMSISPFFIGFVILSIGTNLPELSLAIRSIISKKKELAFGSYLGSAATNTFIFGVLSLINKGETITFNNFV